jgi:hypothetical protein
VESSATSDGWFSSFMPMCLEILAEMWWPIWLMYTLPHEHGIFQMPNCPWCI